MLYLAMAALTLFSMDLTKQLLHSLSPEYGLKKKDSLRLQMLQRVCAPLLVLSTIISLPSAHAVEEIISRQNLTLLDFTNAKGFSRPLTP
jgi:hypothetical protein